MKYNLRTMSRAGLSMAEVVVCTMLVGLVVTTSLKTLSTVHQLRNRNQRQLDAQALGQQLLAEIMQQHYQEPDDLPIMGRESSESGGQRTNWDDVDDYHGWSSEPEDKNGTSLVGYANWRREVTVKYVQIAHPNTTSLLDTGLKRITVTVIDPDGGTTIVQALRSQWGSLEQPLAATTTVHSCVENRLQIGSDRPNYAAANVVNHAE